MNRAAPDSDFVSRARAGDHSALDELAARHRPYLRKIIESRLDDRLAARLDASDLIQETLLEAYRRVQNENAESPLPMRLWLRQIAIDRVNMAQRKHLYTQKRGLGREVVLPQQSSILLARQLLGPQSAERQPDERAMQAEVVEAVRKALAGLPVVDREILTMRTFEDLAYDEIEILTGVSAATCRKRYGRALVRLSKLLDAFTESSSNGIR